MTIVTAIDPADFRGASADVRTAIRAASAETGVDFSYLMAKAAVESSFRPDAKAPTSSATGLYQFIERTWLDMVERHGAEHGLEAEAAALKAGEVDSAMRRQILDLRSDPKLAAAMAAEYTQENVEHLRRTVGGRIGATEQYLAHFLGAGGAEQFLKAMREDPAQAAAEIMPAAARSNQGIFYRNGLPRTLAQVYDHFAAKFEGAAGGTAYAEVAPGEAAGEASPPRLLARSGAIPMPAASTPLMVSPTAYAARIFMATLLLPGETSDAAGQLIS